MTAYERQIQSLTIKNNRQENQCRQVHRSPPHANNMAHKPCKYKIQLEHWRRTASV